MEEIVRQVTARVMAALKARDGSCGAAAGCGGTLSQTESPASAPSQVSASASGYRHGVGVGVSNRHVHLCAADLRKLFGAAYKLEPVRELSQPGEFASTAFVDVEHGGRKIGKLRVLGPLREKTQIELSATDARALKISLPVRNSGDTAGSPGVKLSGPSGSVDLSEGCIIASRHLHLTEADAARLGIKNNQLVSVRLGGSKSGVIDNVFCRVSDSYSYELHIDTDDANAFLQKTGDIAEIIL